MVAHKVHIGCGERRLSGYISFDMRRSVSPDVVANMVERPGFHVVPLKALSVSLIYACMVLEHIGRDYVLPSLKAWREALCPGGVLRLSLPDFAAAARWYNRTNVPDVSDLQGLLLGRQNYGLNCHASLWDWPKAEGLLHKAGFNAVRWWDWKKELPDDYDDFSSAYLPDFCKTTGMHMALNIQGVK